MNSNLILLLLFTISCGSSSNKAVTSAKLVESKATAMSAPTSSLSSQQNTLQWKDRRPIGMIMLASNEGAFVGGNRRWKLVGNSGFSKQALMKHADESIKNLKAVNAQGMITWDIEGQEYPHPYSYLGDPRRIPREIDTLADLYFKKFKDSGFKTGICVRPDSLNYTDGWARHYVPYNIYKLMVEKIDYAYKRWGCTLFYVDSNIGGGQMAGTDNTTGYGSKISADVFKSLMKRFPDCLIVPEHWNEDYLTVTAPLNKHNGTHILKSGFQILDLSDTKWNDTQIQESVKQGNIMMGRVWYNSPELTVIKKAYELKK